MLFNSIKFLLFFVVVIICYYIIPRQRWRLLFIIAASFYFYMTAVPVYAILLISSIVLTYFGGYFIDKTNSLSKKKMILSVFIILNCSTLCFFKYYNFIAENIHSLLNSIGVGVTIKSLELVVPLGISFYTFKSISYLVDKYRKQIEVGTNFISVAAYLSFFPQLIAGPIERFTNFQPQIKNFIPFNGTNLSGGLKLMLWGFFMKLVFADRAGIYVDVIYGNIANHNGTSILLAAILYSFQIYCDFAGYSLMSIGCSKAMGLTVPDNFRRPYLSDSIHELWKRWHISLTRWFTEYLYFPLGGNRCGRFRNYFNIMIVFLVSGIWHGSAWNYIVWGGIHGVVQIVEKMLNLNKRKSVNVIERVLRIVTTFLIATIALIYFRISDITTASQAIVKVFTSVGMPFINRDALPALEYSLIALFLIIVKEIMDEFYPGKFEFFNNKRLWVRYASYIIITLLILLCGVFDEGQFIYAQF